MLSVLLVFRQAGRLCINDRLHPLQNAERLMKVDLADVARGTYRVLERSVESHVKENECRNPYSPKKVSITGFQESILSCSSSSVHAIRNPSKISPDHAVHFDNRSLSFD